MNWSYPEWFKFVLHVQGGMFLSLGLLILIFRWSLFRKSFYLVHHGQLTTGDIINQVRVQFTDSAGREIPFYPATANKSYFPLTIVHTTVPILYDPKSPYRAYFAPPARYFQPSEVFMVGWLLSIWGVSALLGLDILPLIALFLGLAIVWYFSVTLYNLYCYKVLVKRFGEQRVTKAAGTDALPKRRRHARARATSH